MKSSSTQAGSRQWLLLLLLAVPLTLTIVILLKPKQKSWTEEGRVRSTRAETILEKWSKANFVTIERSDTFEQSLGDIPFSFTNTASGPNEQSFQREQAVKSVREILYGLAYKDSDAFLNFRVPVSTFTLDSGLKAYRTSEMKKVFGAAGGIESLQPIELVEKWFQSRFIPRGTNGLVLHDQTLGKLAVGIAIEQSALIVERLDALPDSLNIFVTKEPNSGYVDQKSWTVFDPTPTAMLKKNGHLDCLIIKLHLKPQVDPPMPIFFRCYWDSARKKWLPYEHAIPYADARRQDYAF